MYPIISERSCRRRLNAEDVLAMMDDSDMDFLSDSEDDDDAIHGGSDGDNSESDSNNDTIINSD